MCVYSLSLSAVQRALQKASFRRNWSHHHQPAGGEDVNILIRLSVHLRRRPQVCYVYTCVCVCVFAGLQELSVHVTGGQRSGGGHGSEKNLH